MKPFTAKRDDGQAEWRVLYALLRLTDYGGVVRFETLETALGLNDRERHRLYPAVGRAAKELRKFDSRSLESVRGVGYRVLEPTEHERQERAFRRKSQRQMTTALAVNEATPLDRLNEEARKRSIDRRAGVAMLLGVLTDHERRIKKQEVLMDHVRSSGVETAARLDQQQAEIDRLRQLVERKTL